MYISASRCHFNDTLGCGPAVAALAGRATYTRRPAPRRRLMKSSEACSAVDDGRARLAANGQAASVISGA